MLIKGTPGRQEGRRGINGGNISGVIILPFTNYQFLISMMLIEKNSWWRHQIETFSALLALCAGNSPVTGEFHAERPVTRSFGVFFDLRLNKRLSKQSWGWWFGTPSRSLWRHCNVGTAAELFTSTMLLLHGYDVMRKEQYSHVTGENFKLHMDIRERIAHVQFKHLATPPTSPHPTQWFPRGMRDECCVPHKKCGYFRTDAIKYLVASKLATIVWIVYSYLSK